MESSPWIQLLEEPLPGNEDLLQVKQLERQGGTFTETVVVIRDDLEMQWRLCSSALHDRQHHIAEEYVGWALLVAVDSTKHALRVLVCAA